MLSWSNAVARDAYARAKEILGFPTTLVDTVGGAAIWRTKNEDKLWDLPSIFEKHMVIDESVLHVCPDKHEDSLYSFIRVGLTPRLLRDLDGLTGAIGYDKLKKILWVRCRSLEANIIILKFAMDIVVGKTDIVRAKKVFLKSLSEFQKLSTTDANAKIREYYRNLYDDMILHYTYVSVDSTGFWQGAFSANCGKPERQGFFETITQRLSKKKQITASDEAKIRLDRLNKGKSNAGIVSNAGTFSNIGISSNIGNKERLVNSRDNWYASDSGNWYATNDPLDLRLGWDNDLAPYRFLKDPQPDKAKDCNCGCSKTRKEHLVEANTPWYLDTWYADNEPLQWDMGVSYDQTFIPTYREASRAHTEKDMRGYRDSDTNIHSVYCVCVKCAGRNRPQKSRRTRVRETLVSQYPNTDPRFLADTALLQFDVGSDIQDNRPGMWGTVSQKVKYPQFTDLIQYGTLSLKEKDGVSTVKLDFTHSPLKYSVLYEKLK